MNIVVRTTDINYGGHLGNDRLLALVQEARVAFLASHGLVEVTPDGLSFIIADAALVYKGEAFAGDILRFEVAAGEPTGKGFRLFYRISRPVDGTIIALVENGVVCYDYRQKKAIPLPESVYHMFTV
jgi:acyl-CoA thioesterase FadM